MKPQVVKNRSRKTLSMNFSSARETDPWHCLMQNLANPVRHGIDLQGKCYLSLDLPSEQEENTLDYWLKNFQKVQKEWLSGRWAKERKLSRQINRETFPISQEFKCDVYSYGPFYTCVYKLPLFLFQTDQTETGENKKTVIAPAVYGCYVNTRIHFGNLFFTQAMGWGLCITFSRHSCYNDQNAMLKRFHDLTIHFKQQAWPNIISMYNPRLAHEFLIRNGLKQAAS
ncbi:hypothetical protein JW835_06900 [bacterium]|nr:hypothetical protein [bacterium]